MKDFFKVFHEMVCDGATFAAYFYADVARTLGIFGKLFLHTLAGLLIIALTGVHLVLLIEFGLIFKSGDLISFVTLVPLLDYFSICKIIALFKALEMLEGEK